VAIAHISIQAFSANDVSYAHASQRDEGEMKMAGSFNHCTFIKKNDPDKKNQFVGCILLDHMGDAYESLEEMWFMIHLLAGDDQEKIKKANDAFFRPESHLEVEIKDRIKDARANNFWEGTLDDVMDDKY
jgi:hypothetical protein